MTLPREATAALQRAGLSAEALALLDDLHRLLGPGVLEALGALADEHGWSPPAIGPAELARIRPWLGQRYLERAHGEWVAGRPTPGFWKARVHEGLATGLVAPLGDLAAPRGEVVREVAAALLRVPRTDRPPARGLLLLSRDAHLGNQPGSFSVDLVPEEIAAASALNAAEGRQHTLPGSIGEASGRVLGEPPLALLWEIQPNVHKPSAERSPGARAPWRRYRGWPVITAAAAMSWMRRSGFRCLVLRGAALRVTHEVDPARPLGEGIARHHDRSATAAAEALGLVLRSLPAAEHPPQLAALAKLGLADALRGPDRDALLWELEGAGGELSA